MLLFLSLEIDKVVNMLLKMKGQLFLPFRVKVVYDSTRIIVVLPIK